MDEYPMDPTPFYLTVPLPGQYVLSTNMGELQEADNKYERPVHYPYIHV